MLLCQELVMRVGVRANGSVLERVTARNISCHLLWDEMSGIGFHKTPPSGGHSCSFMF